jgi:N-acetyl-alpha-D-muramate 1-phosphate uridylyltransferase
MPRAIILAAGRGERLRPLTDRMPKPLLPVGGRPLIEWQIERLAQGGFRDLVINHAHLGDMIEAVLGDGRRFGVRIRYSPESPALETAGGIVQAMPLLDAQPFVVVSGDIHTAFDFQSLEPRMAQIARNPEAHVAHLVLVDNPPWHANGDMGLDNGYVTREGERLTYGNIAVFHPRIFLGMGRGTWLKLFPWLYQFVDAGMVTGEHYRGPWDNVGTAEQLAALDRRLSA